jgi:exopolysaccharide biosynthesis polyprenyl glycosylphosphotransferase
MENKKYFNSVNIIVISLIMFDSFAVVMSFLVAYYLRDKGMFRHYLDSIQPIGVYLSALPIAVLIMITICSFMGLYEPRQRVTKISELYTSLRAITLWTLLIMAGSYLAKFDYSRLLVLQLYIYTIIFFILGRLIIRRLQGKFFTNGFGRINILIVGAGRSGLAIAKRLKGYQSIGFRVVGFVDNRASKKIKLLGKLRNLKNLIKKYNIQEVYIADPTLSDEKILSLVSHATDSGTKFKIASNIFDLITGSVDIAKLESIPFLDVTRTRFPYWKIIYKRIFDVVIAGSASIIVLPLFLIISFMIKLDSKGNAIFTQKRVGQKGKIFTMYKFRTMQENTPMYKKSPRNSLDDRVTRIGRILRRTSLDELPQLINVLKGEMSIVGPRPEMPFIAQKYNEWEKKRLMVKPGLTGLWQILGRKDLPLSENLEYDFYYINNHSFLLDIVIILKTIPLVFLGKGAY